MIRDKLKNLIKQAIKQAQKKKDLPDFKIPEIDVEHPEEKSFGDYSTNAAMVIAKEIGKNPTEVARCLTSEVKQCCLTSEVDKIEVAGPGFINFTLSKDWLQKQVGEILKRSDRFGRLKIGVAEAKPRQNGGLASARTKVQIEFISANPTGPLHLGHGRGAFGGDTLANVLDWAGFKIEREYYINDAKISGQIKELGKTVLGKGTVYLTDYLRKVKRSLASREVLKLSFKEAGYLIAQEIHKDIKRFIEGKLKIKFDKWVSEERLYQDHNVSKTEKALREEGLVYEKEGATWLKTSKFGDDKDRVLIKRNGQPTYLLPDIAYHKDKFDRGFDKVIDIWGADHLGHIKPLKIGLKILGYDPNNLEILIIQMVRIKSKGKVYKLSKRKGRVIDLEWLIDEVGLDVARFLYLMKTLNTQMDFDLDLAKKRSEKNPVFYVQYAYARICSILSKAGLLKFNFNKLVEVKLLKHSAELDLIRQLIRFPEVVEDTSRDYQVQRLPRYSLELASCFHYFYKCCRVRTEDKDLAKARLALVLATQIVLKNILGLMGVSAPSKM